MSLLKSINTFSTILITFSFVTLKPLINSVEIPCLSNSLLIRGPPPCTTIKDKPRQQQYHDIDSENIRAFAPQINGNLQQAYTVIKSENASFTHIDVHFRKGGDNSAAKLESAAATKRKEYRAAHESFLRIVQELGEPEPLSPRAAMLCEIHKRKAECGNLWGKL